MSAFWLVWKASDKHLFISYSKNFNPSTGIGTSLTWQRL
jgi:hypothetical protein